jgi:esterase/lipase
MLKTKLIYTKIIILFISYTYSINPIKEYIPNFNESNINYIENVLNYNDVQIYSIYAKHETENENRNTIILAYGDYGNLSYYFSYVSFFYDLGYDVIGFDYRGFGKSSDFNIDKEMLYYEEFAEDLQNVFNYYKAYLNKDKKLGIVSLSMGTILSAKLNGDFDFLIAEGCVYDINSVKERLNKIGKITKIVKDINLPKKWNELKIKMLIIAGETDSITTVEDAKNIINMEKGRKLITYELNHLALLRSENLEEISLKIKIFIDE